MAPESQELRIMLLEVLQDKTVHWAAIAAAADIIAADARFNLWLAQGGKDQGGNRVLELLDRYEETIQACQLAIHNFRRNANRPEFTDALENLARSLVKITG
jgi:hypothetical protein